MTRVLITGANGFVGKALCDHLAAKGYDLVRAVRQSGGDISVGDLSDKTDWRQALEGVESVVHLAARVHVMDDRADDPLALFRAVNRDVTQNLAEQARDAGVKRLVYLSSVKAAGEANDAEALKESDLATPQDPYGQSKLEAEQALHKIAESSTMAVTVLRPPLVYGPGVKGNFLTLLKICKKGLPLPLGGLKNRRSLVYLENLVDAIRAALEAETPDCAVYFVSDGPPVSTPELIRLLSKTLGTSPLLLPVPASLLTLLAKIVGKGAMASRLTGSLEVDCRLIETELGWRPPFTTNQGLAATAAWYRGENR